MKGNNPDIVNYDDMTGIDDYSPQWVAWNAAQEVLFALEKCELTSLEVQVLIRAKDILSRKAGNQ